MLPTLPPEILDLIVDFLHDEPGALKACCLVSKSWVRRIREHIFANVELSWESYIRLWRKTFPDPSNSPARYTRNLTIYTSQALTSGGWVRAFSGLVRLEVDVIVSGSGEKILVPLRGLSPTLKSLYLSYGSSALFSEIFGLVCSFPLLEDLALLSLGNSNEVDVWNIPSTSPKLTGCLELNIAGEMRPTICRLLELPGGLCFSKIVISCSDEDVEPVMDLMSKCSDTLEYLGMIYDNTVAGGTRQLDFSKLTRLKVIWMKGPSVPWIIKTLQTAESTNLQQVIIRFSADLRAPNEELFHREWQELDRLLLQFWTSHSIRLRIEYREEEVGYKLREVVPGLPEFSRGAVAVVCDD